MMIIISKGAHKRQSRFYIQQFWWLSRIEIFLSPLLWKQNLSTATVKLFYDIFANIFLCSLQQKLECTIASKTNGTPKGVRLSEKLQLTAALCNEIWPQLQIWLLLLWASKFATAKIECSFEMGK